MRLLQDRAGSLKQIVCNAPVRFPPRVYTFTGPAGLLAVLALAILLVSPVLAAPLQAPLLPGRDSYNGTTIRVSTQAASGVTYSSATLNGFLESLGPYVEVYVGFEYMLNDGTLTDPAYSTKTALTKMTAPGPFSAAASGLATYTPYQFRAVAESPVEGDQKVIGGYRAFHTLVEEALTPITFSASSVSNVTTGTAVLNGYVESMKSYNEVKVWFDWGPSAGFGSTAGQQIMHEPGPFTVKISGLLPDTRYYYRTGALPTIGGIATMYGTTDTFTTPGAGDLVVSTWPGTDITTASAIISGNLESIGTYASANVWFEWGKTQAYGNVTPMQTVYQAGIYTYRLQKLEEGTTYHYRALAIPGSLGWVTARGPDNKFTTVSLPGLAVNTEPANGITANSAVLRGYITSLGQSDTISAWFEYGTDSSFGSNTQRQAIAKHGEFTYGVTGLTPLTTYYYRISAISNGRAASGQYSTFTTAAPTVLSITTREANLVTLSSAELHAYINSVGSAPAVRAWFNYGTGPECSMNSPALPFSAAGPVSAQISGLTADTTYYFQAVAQTPGGSKAYGKTATFQTSPIPKASVITYPVTGVTDSSATLNGKLDSLGSAASIQAWFEYGTTTDFGKVTVVRTFNSPLAFSSAIPVLPATTYYYRAVGLNPAGGGVTATGVTISFVSASLPSPPPSSPVASPYDWLVYCQRFLSIEVGKILKSLNINFGN